ncbi:FAD-dependent oxidoreductase [Paraburkholderia unamae]|uniref:Fumarate reductase flavoprotein subunit n=1 Tax=Paraburkholderia unamae TaxID=219649 RepID=A0ABX5KJS8_9BURK|nr:FAD-dependent oxidoreductase [Paraburkholderia unamae]PVX75708.1 fumarate reductase flavoprotein subunit [Paraburkholderia unamae]
MSRDFDIVIVGGGGAGLAASILAREAGASVMVLEADTKLGGATALSAAVMYACATSVQRARGIDDTPDAMYRYMTTLAGWECNTHIMRVMCEQSGPALEWLIGLGVHFPPEYLLCSGVDEVPRGHPSHGVADALINAAGAAGVEYALGTRVDRLLVENGRVVGVSAGGEELRAGAVIITTGGFGNSPEMIERFFPTAASHGDWTYAVHYAAPYIVGDGLKLGQSVGAGVVGVDCGLLLPTSGLGKWIEAFLPPWIMLVNTAGRRFMDESAPYAVSGYLLNSQADKRAYAIFDEPTLEKASQDMRFADPYHSGTAMPTWEYNLLRQSIENGKVLKADSIEELAAKIGVDSETLRATVEQYNADCDEGRDSQYFKAMEQRFPVRTGPFYAREVRACVIGQTGAGLDINNDAQVLDEHGRVIPGLYAAGEVLGCAVGKRYSGGGMGICNAMVFGRIAGRAAAEEALQYELEQ